MHKQVIDKATHRKPVPMLGHVHPLCSQPQTVDPYGVGSRKIGTRHHVERLADDHANARLLALSLAEIPGIAIDPGTVETNLVFFDVAGTRLPAARLVAELAARGVQMGAFGESTIRAVTHLDVSRDDILRAVDTLRAVIADTEI